MIVEMMEASVKLEIKNSAYSNNSSSCCCSEKKEKGSKYDKQQK